DGILGRIALVAESKPGHTIAESIGQAIIDQPSVAAADTKRVAPLVGGGSVRKRPLTTVKILLIVPKHTNCMTLVASHRPVKFCGVRVFGHRERSIEPKAARIYVVAEVQDICRIPRGCGTKKGYDIGININYRITVGVSERVYGSNVETSKLSGGIVKPNDPLAERSERH